MIGGGWDRVSEALGSASRAPVVTAAPSRPSVSPASCVDECGSGGVLRRGRRLDRGCAPVLASCRWGERRAVSRETRRTARPLDPPVRGGGARARACSVRAGSVSPARGGRLRIARESQRASGDVRPGSRRRHVAVGRGPHTLVAGDGRTSIAHAHGARGRRTSRGSWLFHVERRYGLAAFACRGPALARVSVTDTRACPEFVRMCQLADMAVGRRLPAWLLSAPGG